MGRQHRIVIAAVVLCSSTLLCGCSKREDPKALMRREVLRANNLAVERRKELDATRVVDDHGDLLPSKQRVAGVILPRGFDPKFTFDYEWYYDGEHPYSKVLKFFTEQLDSETVQQPNRSTLTFIRARTKGDTQMKPVDVTVMPVPGREDWSRIHLVAQKPLPERILSKAEIEAELSMRRRNMR